VIALAPDGRLYLNGRHVGWLDYEPIPTSVSRSFAGYRARAALTRSDLEDG